METNSVTNRLYSEPVGTHRRKRVVAVKLTDDYKVGGVVKKLEKIR